MTNEEIIADERYHTCGRCKWEDIPFICHQCKWGEDLRKDLWQLKEGEGERMTDKEIIDGLYEIKNWKCNGDSKMHSIICGAIDLLEQTRWTPVSELPKEQIKIGEYVFSENVLGTEGHTIRKAYYNYTTKEWFDGNEEMVWTEITHWMPLPEKLPKAESEDKE